MLGQDVTQYCAPVEHVHQIRSPRLPWLSSLCNLGLPHGRAQPSKSRTRFRAQTKNSTFRRIGRRVLRSRLQNETRGVARSGAADRLRALMPSIFPSGLEPCLAQGSNGGGAVCALHAGVILAYARWEGLEASL